MIDKRFVYDNVLPLVKEKSRMLEYYMIQSLFENKDKEIVSELSVFQNDDGGFGQGLEPDVQMPESSVVATDIAISYLDFVRNPELKQNMIKKIVHYYENTYDQEKNRFFMVTNNVDDHPHAVWWNFKDLEKNFPYGNPDPEVIGFLYENRQYLQKLNIIKLINDVVDFVKSDKFLKSSMHTLISVLSFYKRVDNDVQNLIHDRVHALAKLEIEAGAGKWEEYSLEPYKIYIIEPHFVNTNLGLLGENLQYNLDKVEQLNILPNWNWYQYEEDFERVKYDWVGKIYFDIIRALRLHRNL